MSNCGSKRKMSKGGMAKKKYEEGGEVEVEVDKSEGVKGRTSAKAKKDQVNFQRGYRLGLKDAARNFNLQGEDALEDKPASTEKLNKVGEGREKGASDMRAALKGQGAFKKGGKVKPGYHKMPNGKMMKDSEHKGMKKMKAGGKVRGDGICSKGKTKGRMV